MGFFSFITNDTKRSIPNMYSDRPSFTVYLIDNKGNIWEENKYPGYGRFMGKDFYELVAEMNGKKTSEEGFDIHFYENESIAIYPNLVEDKNRKWTNEKPMDCEFQGFFYED